MVVDEGSFEFIFENEIARIGTVRHADESLTVEVLLLVAPSSTKVDSEKLRDCAGIVEKLNDFGMEMRFLEGGWAVGEKKVFGGDAELTVSAICQTIELYLFN